MPRKASLSACGFTLVEALVAVGMSSIFLVSAMSTWTYTTKIWKEESVRSELRYGVEKSLEKMKEDIRLSDGGKISFYPVGGASYTAIGMPREYVNSNGLYDISSGITWADTVIYHVHDNALLRTQVAYNANAAARQAQVDEAATTGSVSDGTTRTLFSADTVAMDLVPSSPEFDGYASSLKLGANTSFGAIQLTPGNHTVRFQITGKNAGSSGYRIGLDSIALTPSGAGREAEALTISVDSGKGKVTEDMSGFPSAGLWGGNHQLEYQSSGIGDFIEFRIYNDEWLESNFSNMTHAYTEVTGTNPALAVASRENQGLLPNWRADIQTGAVEAGNPSPVSGISIRTIVNGSQFTRPSTMVRFKFKASSGGNLRINSAYMGTRSGTTENFLGLPTQLYFGNSPVPPGGSDGIGAMGTTGTADVTIPADNHVWSNWVEFSTAVPDTGSYLVSFSVANGVGNGSEIYWEPGAGTNAYVVNGDRPTEVWAFSDAGYAVHSAVHAVAEMQSWYHIGTGTSQIYDTKMASPAYGQIAWSSNGVGTYLVKVRSSNDPKMVGASLWSSLAGYTSSPSAISGAGNGRYVQFQATMTGASPYAAYPQIDNVATQWPGQTTLVELSGYFTKRPNYGKFKVVVDGNNVVSGLGLNLSAAKTYQGKTQSASVATEIKPKNTGK